MKMVYPNACASVAVVQIFVFAYAPRRVCSKNLCEMAT